MILPKATIIGNEDILNAADHVRVEVDVSKITDNTTLTLPVIISNGITKVTPQLVKATIVVKKQTQKTVSGLPLKIRGLSNNYKAQIDDPVNQMINLSVNGPNSVVDGLTTNDFNAFIDLTSLAEGNHEVKIQVEGPPDVNWTPDKSTATITITKNA
ncbi:CdaR family protein [Neobacillus pocheonensis]|uniref:CdaR family protein n=1 Tax=Neobacillus pocheonensis TaxID=363869 RepID=A0ABT0WGP2_9BACI|nr:CdaR family protein [Neobacillus pocheonensis]